MKDINFKLSAKVVSTLAIAASFMFFSCKSTEAQDPVPVEEPVVEVVVEEKQEEPVVEVVEEAPAEVVPEVQQEPVVEDDEYSRSVGEISVSRDTFEDDKARILHIIQELSIVMRDFDYKSWLEYIDKESLTYWSKGSNLKKAQGRLPVKGLKLNSLSDYFKYVFVPARNGRSVSEIRYISDTYVKAIDVQEEHDIVYYYFNKINGHWMVHLPPFEG